MRVSELRQSGVDQPQFVAQPCQRPASGKLQELEQGSQSREGVCVNALALAKFFANGSKQLEKPFGCG